MTEQEKADQLRELRIKRMAGMMYAKALTANSPERRRELMDQWKGCCRILEELGLRDDWNSGYGVGYAVNGFKDLLQEGDGWKIP